ncbi:5-oxoprolinase subunit PxpA [Aliiglaciecola sp. LCG003]|uniref:5-oxoprolinase subunit PxpA n=1 Tax=Aliiglaciecola sp. LCG003 TaxID=3053655 RepID=UPI0025732848|nr:5-oxoprolinase subunit PxpA [Aliiglaciecola sp. LCG003]WJG11288.1 5-oxoprolinase subunit PxpA [Aliiglaciecola sp. LCG003]
MKLNCDLGEGFGAWKMPNDGLIMPYIDMANIACGFHAGDPEVIEQALRQAKQHNVSIGAHPSYPDKQGFGRRSMLLTNAELIPLLHYQIAAIDGMARVQGQPLEYVKPHGALYNDMMKSDELFAAVLSAIYQYSADLPVVVQATPLWQNKLRIAESIGCGLLFEGFADRRYDDQGLLLSRSIQGAVLDLPSMLAQVERIISHQQVKTVSGHILQLKIDTLCVHGDSVEAVDGVKHIRNMMKQ